MLCFGPKTKQCFCLYKHTKINFCWSILPAFFTFQSHNLTKDVGAIILQFGVKVGIMYVNWHPNKN